jgi:hypothetical protein
MRCQMFHSVPAERAASISIGPTPMLAIEVVKTSHLRPLNAATTTSRSR